MLPEVAVSVVPALGLMMLGGLVAMEERPAADFAINYATAAAKAPLVKTLHDALIGLPGGPFKGSAETLYAADQLSGGIEILHTKLWMAGVPTFDEYSQVLSPQYYYFVSRVLGKPQDGAVGRNRLR